MRLPFRFLVLFGDFVLVWCFDLVVYRCFGFLLLYYFVSCVTLIVLDIVYIVVIVCIDLLLIVLCCLRIGLFVWFATGSWCVGVLVVLGVVLFAGCGVLLGVTC